MSTWIKVGLIGVAIYGLLCVGIYAAMRQPPKVFGSVMSILPAPAVMMGLPMRQLWQSARAGSVQAGDRAPDFHLQAMDRGSRVRLSDFRGVQPVVLVFGSYTCPPFRNDVPRINSTYHKYKDRAAFYLIYIQEAHPSDGWQLPNNVKAEVVFASPTSIEGRGSCLGLLANGGHRIPCPDRRDQRLHRSGVHGLAEPHLPGRQRRCRCV